MVTFWRQTQQCKKSIKDLYKNLKEEDGNYDGFDLFREINKELNTIPITKKVNKINWDNIIFSLECIVSLYNQSSYIMRNKEGCYMKDIKDVKESLEKLYETAVMLSHNYIS